MASSQQQPRRINAHNVFVTVGTTEFESLIETIDNASFVLELQKYGCKSLSVQIGRGLYAPTSLELECTSRGISLEYFRFNPTLSDDMQRADVIISHCGAGSILEAIGLQKQLIVVVNSSLQDNHQTELSDALAAGNYCWSTTPESLNTLLANLGNQGELNIFPKHDPTIFPALVDSMFDWS